MRDDAGSGTPDPRREELLRVARRHFLTHGYAATGMESIAREASISTATLYAWFPGKSALFRSMIEDTALEFGRSLQPARGISGSARERIEFFALEYAKFLADPLVRGVFRLVASERQRFEATAQYFFSQGRDTFGTALITAITEMCESGELKCTKGSWAAGQLMGMIEHPLFFVPMVTGDEVMSKRALEHIASESVITFMARYGHKADGGTE